MILKTYSGYQIFNALINIASYFFLSIEMCTHIHTPCNSLWYYKRQENTPRNYLPLQNIWILLKSYQLELSPFENSRIILASLLSDPLLCYQVSLLFVVYNIRGFRCFGGDRSSCSYCDTCRVIVILYLIFGFYVCLYIFVYLSFYSFSIVWFVWNRYILLPHSFTLSVFPTFRLWTYLMLSYSGNESCAINLKSTFLFTVAIITIFWKGRHDRYGMVVGITTTYAISANRH